MVASEPPAGPPHCGGLCDRDACVSSRHALHAGGDWWDYAIRDGCGFEPGDGCGRVRGSLTRRSAELAEDESPARPASEGDRRRTERPESGRYTLLVAHMWGGFHPVTMALLGPQR